MDRKGKQKVGCICLVLCTMVLVGAIISCNISYERKLYEEQKQELTVIYPEQAAGLSENVTYYNEKSTQAYFFTMLLVIILLFLGLIAVYLLLTYSNKLRHSEVENELDYIYEQLVHFQKGNDDILPLSTENSSQKFEAVCDKLKDLGYYFSNLKERLAQEENSTKTLITDISHQLKTPLATIKMSHELSFAKEFSEEERLSFIETEAREIIKMEALLDELVKLSRLENSMIQIMPDKCSIKKTISEAVSQIYIKANAKDIEICVEMEQDVETMHDHKWTAEALVNILDNAVKYSENNTTIHIYVRCLVKYVLIQVEDEGIGIPEGEVNEIFKRFYRGSNAKSTVKEGAGVGLYLARSIIEQQGGTIVAKRKSEKGTSFKIMLPLSEIEDTTLTKL